MSDKIANPKQRTRPRHKRQKFEEVIPVSLDLSYVNIIKDRFIFDIRSGKFHRASETAAFILRKLKLNSPIPEIVARYAERYGVAKAIAERDVELFLNDMSVVGLPVQGARGTRDRSGAPRRREASANASSHHSERGVGATAAIRPSETHR